MRHTALRMAAAVLVGCAAAMAAAAQAPQPKTLRNLEYARPDSGPLSLDLYLPEAGGPFPLIVWIHGGAFRAGDKAGIWYKPILNQTQRGYAVASIDYRLSGSAKFPALVHDAKAAVRWLRANAAQYNLKADRIVVAGESAGGYQAVMLGTSGGVAELEGTLGNPKESSRVRGRDRFLRAHRPCSPWTTARVPAKRRWYTAPPIRRSRYCWAATWTIARTGPRRPARLPTWPGITRRS